MDLLPPRQRKFIREYLRNPNASEAARKAGYADHSARQTGYRLLTKADIQQRLRKAQRQQAARLEVTTTRVLAELARIAFADRRDLFNDDFTLKKPSELSDEVSAALAGIEVEELWQGRGEDREQIGYLKKVKLCDKVKALELLAKYLGIFKEDRPEAGVNLNVGLHLTFEQRRTVVLSIAERVRTGKPAALTAPGRPGSDSEPTHGPRDGSGAAGG
jgi:phage terminase small subunit